MHLVPDPDGRVSLIVHQPDAVDAKMLEVAVEVAEADLPRIEPQRGIDSWLAIEKGQVVVKSEPRPLTHEEQVEERLESIEEKLNRLLGSSGVTSR